MFRKWLNLENMDEIDEQVLSFATRHVELKCYFHVASQIQPCCLVITLEDIKPKKVAGRLVDDSVPSTLLNFHPNNEAQRRHLVICQLYPGK